MARFLVYIGGQWMASLSTSAFNSECRADSYELYVPADYSGPFDIWGSLSGNCYGNNACISSLFYRLDGNELKTVGVRTLMQPHYSDANGVMHSWGVSPVCPPHRMRHVHREKRRQVKKDYN